MNAPFAPPSRLAHGLMPLALRQCDEWRLAPEGALIHLGQQLAVIADVHLGYEWARIRRGDLVPPHSLAETLEKLTRLLARAPVRTLVVAGDLVESMAPCSETALDLQELTNQLRKRGVDLLPLRGNHDPAGPESLSVDRWTIHHGDHSVDCERAIIGHHHPALRLAGQALPCFLVSQKLVVLPAFTPNAAGLDLLARRLPPNLTRLDFRCVAAAEDKLFDLGPLRLLTNAKARFPR